MPKRKARIRLSASQPHAHACQGVGRVQYTVASKLVHGMLNFVLTSLHAHLGIYMQLLHAPLQSAPVQALLLKAYGTCVGCCVAVV